VFCGGLTRGLTHRARLAALKAGRNGRQLRPLPVEAKLRGRRHIARQQPAAA
jgi:hypothetical protein